MSAPTITVALVHFNQARFFSAAWESVLAQGDSVAQIIVTDDASRPEEFAAIKEIMALNPSAKAIVVADENNRGLSGRLNQILPMVTSDWLSVIAADDAYTPNGLALLAEKANPDLGVVWGNLEVMNEAGESLHYIRPRQTWQGSTAKKYQEPGYVFADMLKVNSFVTGGMSLINVQMLRELDGWDESLTTEDFDLWLRAGRKYRFRFVDEVIGYYRVVAGSKSRNDSQKLHDQALLLGKYVGESKKQDRQLAYLAAMRWSLAVARNKRLPDVSLQQLAGELGVSPFTMWSVLPAATLRPIVGSLVAALKRLVQRH